MFDYCVLDNFSDTYRLDVGTWNVFTRVDLHQVEGHNCHVVMYLTDYRTKSDS